MRISRLIVVSALFAVFSAGCAGCGETVAGSTCDPDRAADCEHEEMDLVCTADDEGEYRCLHPAGASCDPDEEPDMCSPGSECQQRDGTHQCLVERAAECDPEEGYCQDDMVCAETEGDDHRCFNALVVQGVVFDAESLEPIEGAHVIASDEEQSVLSDVGVTDANGEYELQVPAARDENGEPLQERIFLRASAQDYQTFPGGLQESQPIDVSQASDLDERWVVDTAQTDIALIELPASDRGHPAIHGRVDIDGGLGGVLVVAEPQGVDPEQEAEPVGFSAVSALDGAFTIFNVSPGDYDVRGFIADYQIEPEAVGVSDADIHDVILHASSEGLRDVSGSLEVIRTEGQTSVILMVASTFDETTVRGEAPAGLRAPRTGEPDITGNWTIEGVPAGRYVAMAGFEIDDLVRSPDEGIAGTDIVHIDVPAGEGEFAVQQSFKVVEALETFGPGRDGPEGLSAPPTLSWGPIANAEHYDVVVFDSFGEVVMEESDIPHQPGATEYELEYTGPFEDGMYYQFRATSWRMGSPTSTTELLRGVFFHE